MAGAQERKKKQERKGGARGSSSQQDEQSQSSGGATNAGSQQGNQQPSSSVAPTRNDMGRGSSQSSNAPLTGSSIGRGRGQQGSQSQSSSATPIRTGPGQGSSQLAGPGQPSSATPIGSGTGRGQSQQGSQGQPSNTTPIGTSIGRGSSQQAGRGQEGRGAWSGGGDIQNIHQQSGQQGGRGQQGGGAWSARGHIQNIHQHSSQQGGRGQEGGGPWSGNKNVQRRQQSSQESMDSGTPSGQNRRRDHAGSGSYPTIHSAASRDSINLPTRNKQESLMNTSQSSGGDPSKPSPDAVIKAENAAIANKELQRDAPLKVPDEIDLPQRPDYGNQGKQITLHANYFEVRPEQDLELHIYSVDIQDRSTSQGRSIAARKRKRAFEMLFKNFPLFRSHLPALATDYMQILVSLKKIEFAQEPAEYKVDYCEVEDEGEIRDAKAVERSRIVFSIRHRLSLPMQDFMSYVHSTASGDRFDDKETIIQALNIIMARRPSTSDQITTATNSTKFFPHRAALQYGTGSLVPVRGYYTSVRMATSRLLINVNCIASTFYKQGPLNRVIAEYRTGNQNSIHTLGSFLKGVRVRLLYLKNSKGVSKTRIISGVVTGNTPATSNSFAWKQSDQTIRQITVAAYFQEKHGITVRPESILINVGNAANPMLVPEGQCQVLPGQLARKKLSGQQTSQMINFAVRGPGFNAADICGEGVETMGFKTTDGPSLFKLNVTPTMVEVHARILDPPRILYFKGATRTPTQGQWNMERLNFYSAYPASTKPFKWGSLEFTSSIGSRANFRPERFQQLSTYEAALTTELRNCGINVSNSTQLRPNTLDVSPGLSFAEKKGKIGDRLRSLKGQNYGMIYILLPDDDKEVYAALKYIADTKVGIHTICTSRTSLKLKQGRQLAQFFANVALKVNLKLGGVNQQLNRQGGASVLQLFKIPNTMVVGIDVTHPSPGSLEKAPSIAAVVASINTNCGQWPGEVFLQNRRQEILSNLANVMKNRLNLWREKNNLRYPESIIVYRDGVSEGEHRKVLTTEWAAIRQALREIGQPNVPVSIFIVGKRHHTRFFPIEEKDMTANKNPFPGLVVDRDITNRREWDFFLQAHDAIKGTARPAHVFVLLDQNKFKVDELEQLTHNLCHLYGRATRAVSLPAPVFYAHLLCERGRCFMYEALNPRASASAQVFDPTNASWDGRIARNFENAMYYV